MHYKRYILLIITLFTLSSSPAFAGDASLFLSSGSGVWLSSQALTTRVMINSGGDVGINAAEGTIKFDPKYLQVAKIIKTNSIFSLWTVNPSFDNKKGTVTFAGGTPKSYKDTAGEIFSIQFTPLKKGKTKTEFGTSTILSGDGQARNVLKEAWVAYFTLDSSSAVSSAGALAKKMSGRILLQVEDSGKSWYMYPADNRRYFLGRPADAFNLMRKLSLGVNHAYITKYVKNAFPAKMSGRILLDVEDNGKAYYINPLDLKGYYLGRPADAFSIMRQLGLGINNDTIYKIDDWAI